MPRCHVTLRFYAELNDLLPRHQRFREILHDVDAPTTAGEVIAGHGVPLERVELVLVNGESSSFSTAVDAGDRIAVYPVFESFDVAAELRVRGRPLRRTRFVVDDTLPGLAARLSRLGLDVVEERGEAAVELSRREGCILLTRRAREPREGGLTRTYRVTRERPREQLAEVLARLHLD